MDAELIGTHFKGSDDGATWTGPRAGGTWGSRHYKRALRPWQATVLGVIGVAVAVGSVVAGTSLLIGEADGSDADGAAALIEDGSDARAVVIRAALAAGNETDEADATNGETDTATTIGAGCYVVGEDIEAGEYKLTCMDDIAGYWCVYTSADETEAGDLLANDSFSDCSYVKLEEGQYIEVVRAEMVSADAAEAGDATAASGLYKVGSDLAAGTYALSPVEDADEGYYCIWDSSAAAGRAIVENATVSSETEIEVEEGQYLSLYNVQIEAADE